MIAALGLMLCDQVIVDQRSRSPSPINIFTGLAVDQFPSEPQRFSVFVALTEGAGAVEVELVALRLDTLDQVYAQKFTVNFPGPLAVINVNFRVRHIRFPVPGVYEFVLLTGEGVIAQRRVRIYQGQGTQ